MKGKHIFLIGPGGVGKSTVAPLIAARLQRPCLDLDQEFCDRIENIDVFIKTRGYLAYVEANSGLLDDILSDVKDEPAVIPVSSGFLASDSPRDIFLTNKARVMKHNSVLLLPSEDKREAANLVVERMACRRVETFGQPFADDADEEGFRAQCRDTFLRRFDEYLALDCPVIFSTEAPDVISDYIVTEVGLA